MNRPLPLAIGWLAAPALVLATADPAQAQTCDWQQRADYVIRATLDPSTHRYRGEETIVYTNNSPDTLKRLYFHLYNNAFQPGSAMDVRSRNLPDADRRVGDRIGLLTEAERGFLHITSLRLDDRAAEVIEQETIALVATPRAILPGQRVTIELTFEAQAPLQVRRSGRDNAEGVDYSMSQWYPKLSAYDADGWHPNPYIGREFYGVWGDFDVTIGMPADYVFAGTGYAADPSTDGNDRFFAGKSRANTGDRKLHRRVAPMVHDFTWAADTDYRVDSLVREDGVRLEAVYLPGDRTTDNWTALLPIMSAALDYANTHFGQYPYRKYAFIQGGDGGMEYAMCTLITGERNLGSLVGVSVHEMMHSWYQFVLATDEAQYPWMDEGFTSYASAEIMAHLIAEGHLAGEIPEGGVHAATAKGYARFANTGLSEPLSTHADHYTTNAAYGVGSYSKGELFLHQLRTVVGDEAFARGMLRYYDTWKMRHPTPRDFIRVMERESGQVLDWYLGYMLNTTHQIDYAVDTLAEDGRRSTRIVLRREGVMPFPVEVSVELRDGSTSRYLIPLELQRGHAPSDGRLVLPAWTWTHPTYEFTVPARLRQIARVAINERVDHSEADETNDAWPRPVVEEEEATEEE